MLSKMSAARKTLEHIANSSFDKPLAKCVYLLASESLQCENEIRSHIGSLNCTTYEDKPLDNKNASSLKAANNIEALCIYFEEVYLKSYKKLLNDKNFGKSIKDLIQHHIEMFMSSLTQLRLFNDVKNAVN
jgi:hypothetical protein